MDQPAAGTAKDDARGCRVTGHGRRQRQARVAVVRLPCLGQPEVEHLDRPVGPKLDVRRFEIAVDDALLVRLFETGRDPSMLIGGITANFDGSFRDGAGPDFVVEGDEYDTAFFDKTPKFLHYHAQTLVITSVEFDHADIYADMDAYRKSFQTLVDMIPVSGLLVACVDDPEVAALADRRIHLRDGRIDREEVA